MPSLSFDKVKGARPISIVRGGDNDGKVLYLHEDDYKGTKPTPEIDAHKYRNEMRGLKPNEKVQLINRLTEAKKKGLTSDQLVGEVAIGKQLYDRILTDEANEKAVVLPDDSTFQILPSADPGKRDVFYIAGASGSGKSYIAKQIAEMYRKLHPEREVYLISKLGEDSTLDSMRPKPKRISIDTLIDDYPELEEFNECLVIFDDFDTFTGDAQKITLKLIDDLATMGRHTKTTMLVLSHYLSNYKQTRLILNEATHFVVYPQATSHHALSYLLKAHVGMTPEDVKELKKLGRWVCVAKNFPQHIISAHTAKVLHQ
jgi:hypothetical protein